MKLSGTRLLVKDFKETFRFYTEKLGLKPTWGDENTGYASFEVGVESDSLSIFGSDEMAEVVGNAESPYSVNNRDKTAIIFAVEDVDKLYRELMRKGVEFLNEPTDMGGWGMRSVHMRDNEGNLIELMQSLPPDKWDEELLKESEKF